MRFNTDLIGAQFEPIHIVGARSLNSNDIINIHVRLKRDHTAVTLGRASVRMTVTLTMAMSLTVTMSWTVNR